MQKILKLMLCAIVVMALFTVSALADGDGIDVQLNGTPVDFTDATPQVKNERTFLPFRAVFGALGFEDDKITYDYDTDTVKADKEDLTVSMVIGEKKITVIRDGETQVISTDVPAYVDYTLSRTFVPVRFISEAVGCNVGWDQDDQTVIIDDVDAIMAANSAKYTIMDKYLAYANRYSTGAYAVNASLTAGVDMAAESETMAMDITGDMKMLIEGLKADAEAAMNITGSVTADGTTVSLAETGIPAALDMDIRYDMTAGTMAMQSDAFATLMPEAWNADTWYVINMGDMLAGSGMEWADLLASTSMSYGDSFEEMLAALLHSISLTDKYADTSATLAAINALFSNDAFVHSGNGYVSRQSFTLDGTTTSFEFTVSGTGTTATGYAMELSVTQAPVSTSTVTANISASMQGDDMTAHIEFGTTVEGVRMDMNMDMEAVYGSAGKSPAGAPPAGAKTADFFSIIGAAG